MRRFGRVRRLAACTVTVRHACGRSTSQTPSTSGRAQAIRRRAGVVDASLSGHGQESQAAAVTPARLMSSAADGTPSGPRAAREHPASAGRQANGGYAEGAPTSTVIGRPGWRRRRERPTHRKTTETRRLSIAFLTWADPRRSRECSADRTLLSVNLPNGSRDCSDPSVIWQCARADSALVGPSISTSGSRGFALLATMW